MRPIELPIRGCHPLWLSFPEHSCHSQGSADPRSLATTSGVSVDFLSSGYLDVSVPRVCSYVPMYSGYKYLSYPIIDHIAAHLPNRPEAGPGPTLQSNNNRVSGGLPHSEIHGSKLILSSPWLIAEYHVLHRLLLPRHSPNALFALDLIQKTQDFAVRVSRSEVTFPAPAAGSQPGHFWLVYLTWNKIAVEVEPRGHPTLG
jgi:hypothetical protein